MATMDCLMTPKASLSSIYATLPQAAMISGQILQMVSILDLLFVLMEKVILSSHLICTLETKNQSEIDFDMLNNSTSIREAKFLELQKEIEAVNKQFKNTLKQKHDLMLHNDSLLKNLHEAELK